MQNYFKKETPEKLVFERKIEDIPGGITVAVRDLTQKRIFAGTPVGPDQNGLYHVVKTARVREKVTTGTAYKVDKGHNFKVGDILAYNGVGYAISSINVTAVEHDVISVATSLGEIEAGAVVFEGDKSAASDVTFKYVPSALVGTTMDIIEGDNHLTDGVVRGSVREAAIGAAISSEIKKALSLIRFV